VSFASTAALLGRVGRARPANLGWAPRAAPISTRSWWTPRGTRQGAIRAPHGGLLCDPSAEQMVDPGRWCALQHLLASPADRDLVSVPNGWAVSGSTSALPPALSPGLVGARGTPPSSPLAWCGHPSDPRGPFWWCANAGLDPTPAPTARPATPPPSWRRPARARPGCWASRRQTRPGARRLGSRAGGSSSGSSRAPAER